MDNASEQNNKKPISDLKSEALKKAREAKSQKRINEQNMITNVQQTTLSNEEKLANIINEITLMNESILTIKKDIVEINNKLDEDTEMDSNSDDDSFIEEKPSKKRKREVIEEAPTFMASITSSPFGKIMLTGLALAAGRYLSQMNSNEELINEGIEEERLVNGSYKKRKLHG